MLMEAKENAFQEFLSKLPKDVHSSQVHEMFVDARKRWEAHALQSQGSSSATPSANPGEAAPRRGRRDIHSIPSTRHSSKSESSNNAAGQHWSCKKYNALTKADYKSLREDCGIQLQARNILARFVDSKAQTITLSMCPNPIRCWGELISSEEWSNKSMQQALHNIQDLFVAPTPIQLQGISLALGSCNVKGDENPQMNKNGCKKFDVIAVAETGSGKTVAYVTPALAHIFLKKTLTEENKFGGAFCLVIVPNRELALQVTGQVQRLTKNISPFRVACIVGGTSVEEQHEQLQNGVHMLVGTPGQLTKLMNLHYLAVGNTDLVIIDEADTIIEEGMSDQLCQLLAFCPKERQTLMYTATFLPECEQIASIYLAPSYFLVTVKHRFPTISQHFELFQEMSRPESLLLAEIEKEEKDGAKQLWDETTLHPKKVQRLCELLSPTTAKPFPSPIIVFVNERKNCDALCDMLEADNNNLQPVVIHGEMRQEERQRAMQAFRSGQYRVLVTTDMLARGLDIPNVSLVVNFDMPCEFYAPRAIVRYIHRIGRTGRAGAEGATFSFITLGQSAVNVLQEEPAEEDEDEDEESMIETTETQPPLKKLRSENNKKKTLPKNDVYLLPELLKFLSGCQHPSVKQIPVELRRIVSSMRGTNEISGAPLML